MRELMTEGLAKGLPPLYATEGEGDPVALVHYFSCLNGPKRHVSREAIVRF